MSTKSKVNSDLRTSIMRIIACTTEPVTNDTLSYKLGMRPKTIQEATQKMFADGTLQRAKLGRGWRYYLSVPSPETLAKTAGEAFAGTIPETKSEAAAA